MKPQTEVALSILAYSLCSGTLVLLNKVILVYIPYPSLVVSFQLVATLTFIYTATKWFGLPCDPLKWEFIVPYLYYIIAFSLGVYCNMKSLTLSNVETVIVFRALSPCVVAFWDAWFLGREYPSTRSWCGLGIIVAGAYGYASFDEKFQTQGWQAYTWPTIYLFIISFEMAYGKKIVKSVDLRTLSGPVLYTNLLGLPPMLMFAWAGNEYSKASEDWEKGVYIPTIAFVALFLGCVAGTGIGYSGWWCRGKVSATTYTLIGVINKCLTILLNLVIWDKHAPPGGIASLLLCLVGGAIYQQAPMRKDAVASDKAAVADGQNDEEKQELVQQDVLKRRTEGGSPSRSRSPKRDGDVI